MNDLIPSVSVPVGEKGQYRIERKAIHDPMLMVTAMQNGGRFVPDGEYAFLYRGGTLVMSDTPNEKRDHYSAVLRAKGHCLIAGLGLGMVLNAICAKPEVVRVTVVEISQEVIDLVAPFYEARYPGKCTFICADILEWKPPKDARYGMAWFDIWDDLCVDNLEEMAKLHRRFARRVEWQGSWGKELLQYERRRYARSYW